MFKQCALRVVVLVFLAPLLVCAQPDVVIRQALGDLFTPVKDVAETQSRLVIYRPSGDGTGVITLHMDGRYHTSLQSGAFSVICLASTSSNLQAQPGRSWARADPAREVSQNIVMSGGQTLFVRLSEMLPTRPKIEVVPLHVATQEIYATRQQIHSISRVTGAKPCVASPKPSLAMAPDVVSLTEQMAHDPSVVLAIAKRLSAKYAAVKSAAVHIVGHVDDAGTEANNQALSTQLAQEVQRHFSSEQTRFSAITSEGRGSKDRSSNELQLHRRVEIGITVLDN